MIRITEQKLDEAHALVKRIAELEVLKDETKDAVLHTYTGNKLKVEGSGALARKTIAAEITAAHAELAAMGFELLPPEPRERPDAMVVVGEGARPPQGLFERVDGSAGYRSSRNEQARFELESGRLIRADLA